jgi:hypothetical protein
VSDTKIEAQINRLDLAVESLEASVVALDRESFLAKFNGWSPRDILAHLIGWNRHVIEGSKQIQRGELPFYDIDPGEDYSKVNASLVHHYSSTDRQLLLQELHASARDLKEFLASLDAEVWASDFGVRHGESKVTIRDTIDELIEDYDHHRRQIEKLLAEDG